MTEMTFSKFQKEAARIEKIVGCLSIKEFEDFYWDQITGHRSLFTPKYSIDNHFSLFPNSCDQWNLNKFTSEQSVIHWTDNSVRMDGIHTPYVYVGMSATCFGFHIEDGDLCSINYHHGGAPKLWYIVPGPEGRKLEKIVASKECSQYIRHKNTMVPPSLLKKHKIEFSRVR